MDARYTARGIVTKVELLASPEARCRVTVVMDGHEFTGPWGLADPPQVGDTAGIQTMTPTAPEVR